MRLLMIIHRGSNRPLSAISGFKLKIDWLHRPRPSFSWALAYNAVGTSSYWPHIHNLCKRFSQLLVPIWGNLLHNIAAAPLSRRVRKMAASKVDNGPSKEMLTPNFLLISVWWCLSSGQWPVRKDSEVSFIYSFFNILSEFFPEERMFIKLAINVGWEIQKWRQIFR